MLYKEMQLLRITRFFQRFFQLSLSVFHEMSFKCYLSVA